MDLNKASKTLFSAGSCLGQASIIFRLHLLGILSSLTFLEAKDFFKDWFLADENDENVDSLHHVEEVCDVPKVFRATNEAGNNLENPCKAHSNEDFRKTPSSLFESGFCLISKLIQMLVVELQELCEAKAVENQRQQNWQVEPEGSGPFVSEKADPLGKSRLDPRALWSIIFGNKDKDANQGWYSITNQKLKDVSFELERVIQTKFAHQSKLKAHLSHYWKGG